MAKSFPHLVGASSRGRGLIAALPPRHPLRRMFFFGTGDGQKCPIKLSTCHFSDPHPFHPGNHPKTPPKTTIKTYYTVHYKHVYA